MYERRIGLTPSLCDPPDEQPIAAQDPLCKYSYDCGALDGLHGEALATVELYIRRRCGRLLHVLAVPPGDPEPPRVRRTSGAGAWAGTTSQDQAVRFRVRDGRVRGFRVTSQLTCSIGSQAVKRQPEDIGPFPAFATVRGRFRQSFEAPNETANYTIAASLEDGAWQGSFRIIEGWSAKNGHPDPDGAIQCDTGRVTFRAVER